MSKSTAAFIEGFRHVGRRKNITENEEHTFASVFPRAAWNAWRRRERCLSACLSVHLSNACIV